MSISKALRKQVRQRANYACEFCSVSETDSGGELTIDHFQPVAKGGEEQHRLLEEQQRILKLLLGDQE